MVALHALWIFSRVGECVFYEEWEERRRQSAGAGGNGGNNTGNSSSSVVRQLEREAQAAGNAAPGEGGASSGSDHQGQPGGQNEGALSLDESHKLMYGMLYSLKALLEQVIPAGAERPGADGGLRCFSTNSYKLHFFESATRVKIVLLTEPAAPDLHEALQGLYSDIYVSFVVQNPRYDVSTGAEPITKQNCEQFVEQFQRRMSSLAGGSLGAGAGGDGDGK
jgi:trafficking protein particle complex subunit 1